MIGPIATARVTCAGSPMQIEGQLDDGRWYYFRARYMGAQLGIGATPEDAVAATMADGGGVFLAVTNEGERFQMGMLDEAAGRVLLGIMVWLYLDRDS